MAIEKNYCQRVKKRHEYMGTCNGSLERCQGPHVYTCQLSPLLTFLLRIQKDYEANLKMEDQTEESEAKIKKNICPW